MRAAVSIRMAAPFVVGLLLASTGVPTVEACACCAEPGEWVRTEASLGAPFSDLTRAALETLPFSGRLAGVESRWGREPVSASFQGTDFVVALAESAREAFRFACPNAYIDFRVATSADISGPLLYKEMIFEGRLIQKMGNDEKRVPSEGRLILQAYGNRCLNAGDFESWILQQRAPGGGVFVTVASGEIEDGPSHWKWRIEERGTGDRRR